MRELFAAPGASATSHEQPAGVVVSLSRSRFETAGPEGDALVDYQEGQILWVPKAERRAWRLLAGEAHIFFVEVKSLARAGSPPVAPRDPRHSTVVDPEQHHLVLDNEHVRVIDGMAGPGSKSAPHVHPPSVLVSLAKSRFRVTIEGKTRVFDFEPGMVRWTNHFEHTWEILSGEARVVMVEIKSAETAPEFQRRRAPRPTD